MPRDRPKIEPLLVNGAGNMEMHTLRKEQWTRKIVLHYKRAGWSVWATVQLRSGGQPQFLIEDWDTKTNLIKLEGFEESWTIKPDHDRLIGISAICRDP